MPYIKLSDTAVLDSSSWTQVLNVINSHSDSIQSISQSSSQLTIIGDNWADNYNPAAYRIEYGKTVIPAKSTQSIITGQSVQRVSTGAISTLNNKDWEKLLNFNNSFSSTPIIVATAELSGSTQTNDILIVTTSGITSTGFKVRILKPAIVNNFSGVQSLYGNPINGDIIINWMAIGPK